MSGVTWVYIMLGVYIVYCVYMGMQGYFSEKTSSGYAIAGRSIPFIAFLFQQRARALVGGADRFSLLDDNGSAPLPYKSWKEGPTAFLRAREPGDSEPASSS